MIVLSEEEKQDAVDYVEDILAEAIGDIEDMMRRKASYLVLTDEQRKRIQFAVDVLNRIEVRR